MDRQELAIRYLLGDLSEEEENTIGRRYLSESEESEELEIAEDELIDRYVRSKLSAKDSSRFEKMLLSSPRLRERVEFAKILVRRVSLESPLQAVTPSSGGSKPRKKKGGGFLPWGGFWGTTTGMAPALRFAVSASVILMLTASAVLVFFWIRQQAESRRLAQEQEQQQRQQREAERRNQQGSNENRLAESNQAQRENEQQKNVSPEAQQQRPKQPDRQAQSQSFAFFLSPTSGSRSTGGPQFRTLNIPRKAPSVQLNLDVEHDDSTYSLYNASLENMNDNRVIARENNLRSFSHRGRKHIRLEVPRRDLTDGLYSVHVDGVTASGQTDNFNDYTFRIRVR